MLIFINTRLAHENRKLQEQVLYMFEKVRKLIAEQLGIEESKIKETSDFITDLQADSLDIVQMLIAMETEFGIEFDDSEMQNVKTVADVVAFISSHAK